MKPMISSRRDLWISSAFFFDLRMKNMDSISRRFCNNKVAICVIVLTKFIDEAKGIWSTCRQVIVKHLMISRDFLTKGASTLPWSASSLEMIRNLDNAGSNSSGNSPSSTWYPPSKQEVTVLPQVGLISFSHVCTNPLTNVLKHFSSLFSVYNAQVCFNSSFRAKILKSSILKK